ncbi:LytR/AlgR family response regulator transcription factor [Lacrimispora celerecrescens]|uniref:Stage 0 sporulation protein A homolog n=1 Tax=[Clostridium] celerecrescens 18A TaxID=1286362 RepID=A0A2M8ZBR5_9FIRM|nr:LytTR family DNA-binding domain-containing protein [Lacrimispora celerecrescens]PJJ30858.1 LytTR family two component transcriptional regulator [[Clostridium] celerecrescens 18A]
MKIAVIDDERPARKELIHQILSILPDSLIKEAGSGAAALELLEDQSFDLLFLDINLNDMEGTTLASAVKRMLPEAQIVFATAYSQYAVKAFELGVSNYILKPFDPERVRLVLEKCSRDLARLQKEKIPAEDRFPSFPANRMPICVNRTITLLDISQIVYIETCLRSCIIHTVSKDYTENQLLGEYEKRLVPYSFCRIHKSYLVNLNYIAEMFPWAGNSMAVKMQGFEQNILPVGREKVKHLRQLIGI